MADQKRTEPIRFKSTAPMTMCFPHLFQAKAYQVNGKDKGEPKYGMLGMMDPSHPDVPELRKAIAKCAKARWPDVDLKTIKTPMTTGDKLADRRKKKSGKDDADFQRGKICVKASGKYPPKLAGIEDGQIVEYIEDMDKAAAKAKFYFGADVLWQITLVAWEGDDDMDEGGGKRGVTAYLDMVMVTGGGKRLGGQGPSAKEAFSGYVGKYSGENVSADDEIPF
jgi:hypothetical protein